MLYFKMQFMFSASTLPFREQSLDHIHEESTEHIRGNNPRISPQILQLASNDVQPDNTFTLTGIIK